MTLVFVLLVCWFVLFCFVYWEEGGGEKWGCIYRHDLKLESTGRCRCKVLKVRLLIVVIVVNAS